MNFEYTSGEVLDFLHDVAAWGETFIDPFIGPSGTEPVMRDAFEGVKDKIGVDLYAIVNGVVIPTLYATVYFFPELVATTPDFRENGLDLPFKPFEYMRVLLDLTPDTANFAIDQAWDAVLQ